MRRIFALGLLPALAPLPVTAADHWTKFIAAPYQVYTDAGTHAGREALVRFEEFRHAIGEVLGDANLQTQLPVRILVFRDPQGWTTPAPVSEGRASYNIVLGEKDLGKGAVAPAVYSALTRLFLESNTRRMPPEFERGLAEFFSTFSLKDIHITVGDPPPNADLDWARIHLFVTDPDYYGKLRVLLYNLRNGAAVDPAYRNAFGKSYAEIEAIVKQRFAEHDTRTTSISSQPMAERDFPERDVSDADARLARADLFAGEKSAAEYERLIKDGLHTAEAEEGLGMIALAAHRPDEAKTHFADAVRDNSSSPRAYIEYAKLEPDNAKATTALLKAAGINPKLDEPFALLAARDTDPEKRLQHWKLASDRAPRNTSYWQHLAEAYAENHDYDGAAKAWTSAEQSATDPATRDRMHAARLTIEQQRLDYEAAEKRRKAEEEAREIERLKSEARAQVHALEEKYADKSEQNLNPVPWWDDPKTPAKVSGTLTRVDCLPGSQARLVILTADRKTVQLLVIDPAKLSISGAADAAFRCGAGQKPRRVTVGYTPKANAHFATAGEAAVIQFQ